MEKEMFLKKAKVAAQYCEAHKLISAQARQNANPFYPEHFMALQINLRELHRCPRPKLDCLVMSSGLFTAEEWMKTQPQAWFKIETEAIYECLKRGWNLNAMTIQSVARELDAMLNPKG